MVRTNMRAKRLVMLFGLIMVVSIIWMGTAI